MLEMARPRLLGKNIELCDPPPAPDRAEIYRLRGDLRPINAKGCRSCGVAIVPGIGGVRPTHVAIMIRATRAHFHGTLRCASWCACPVCSVALRLERSRDVVKCVNWWRDNPDCEVLLLTLTLAHSM